MRTANAALQTVLAKGPPYVVADLYDITLADGTQLHWTGGQTDIQLGGQLYTAGPNIRRDKISWKRGLEVDQVRVIIGDNGKSTINAQSLVSATWKRMLDNANIVISIFISDSWSNLSPGPLELFTGLTGQITVRGKLLRLTVESPLVRLKSMMPRNPVLPSCNNTLFDTACGLLEANFSFAGSVGAGPSAKSFTLSGVAQPDGYFTGGKIKFASGANAGQARGVKSYVGGVVTLSYPLYVTPTAGDTVTAVAGCDYTRATCNGTFANLSNYRGFPYVPDPNVQITGAAAAGQGGRGASNHIGVRGPAGGGLRDRGGRIVPNRS